MPARNSGAVLILICNGFTYEFSEMIYGVLNVDSKFMT